MLNESKEFFLQSVALAEFALSEWFLIGQGCIAQKLVKRMTLFPLDEIMHLRWERVNTRKIHESLEKKKIVF